MGLLLAAFLTVAQPIQRPEPIIVQPAPISAQARTWARVAVAAQMVTCGIDYGTTMYAMGTGRFEERNPVWAWAEHRPVAMGVTKLGSCAAVSTILLKEHAKHPKRTIIIASVLTGVSMWAIIQNSHRIRQQ